MASVRRRRVLIPGPVLVGFAEMFDRTYGNPKTPRPYPKVTPSRIGQTLLPFTCPHCGEVRSVVVDHKKGRNYSDQERGFSWCPACRGRYILNTKGQPLESPLPSGATHAPALVERDGKVEVVGLLTNDGLDALGAL